ncbi:hypothetical protein [Eubacterium sp.]|uniref:hypothetical protein n=1 Tax=Eubacterium sp. TaxID=142586 RepID=UPI0025F0C1B2|nr:hypothetical protein [Eubacterium sp.]MCR5629998.1 hypothetical protein [Eubacterium sp.]
MEKKIGITCCNITLILFLVINHFKDNMEFGNLPLVYVYIVLGLNFFILYKEKTEKIELILNIILISLFVYSLGFKEDISEIKLIKYILFDFTENGMIPIICIVILSIWCYKTNRSINSKSLIFVVLGIFILAFGQNIIAEKKLTKKEEYSFDKETYNKIEKLYNNSGDRAYDVYDYTEDAIYVKDLFGDETHFFKFDSKEKRDEFVEKYTLGYECHVEGLSRSLEFDSKNFTINMHPSYEEYELREESFKYNKYTFPALLLWILLVFLFDGMTINYEKAKIINE